MDTEHALKPFKIGDLVCMYRRKKQGLGEVLDYIPDIEECLGIDPRGTLEIYRSYTVKEWRNRDRYRQQVCMRSKCPDLAFDFFIYNTAFADSLKISFVEVQWFKRPSTFSVDGISAPRGWFPAAWVRRY